MGQSRHTRTYYGFGVLEGLLLALALALLIGLAIGSPGNALAASPFTFSDSDCTVANMSTLVTALQTAVSSGQSVEYTGTAPCTVELGGTTVTPQDGVAVSIEGGVGLTLDHVTLEKGNDGIDAGGASGAITLTDSTISGFATSAIDVYRASATLTVTDSTISGVSTSGEGIFASDASGAITVTGSTISGAGGNGIDADGASGAVTVTGSTLSDNGSSGLSIVFASGPVTLSNSTISGNDAAGINGYSFSGTFTITDSTIGGNDGDGIDLPFATGTLTIIDSTIAGNHRGIDAPSATVRATILANSPSANCSSAITDGGYNLSTDASCTTFGGTSRQNVPLTSTTPGTGINFVDDGALDNYGGPTQTIALGPGSIAIDFIPAADCPQIIDPATGNPITTDQRGINRPHGTGCDAGAYEAVPSTSTLVTIQLEDHAGNPITATNGTASYYHQGWHTIGATSNGSVQVTVPSGSYSFAMVYQGSREQLDKVVVSGATTTVTFQTVLVTAELKDHTGTLITPPDTTDGGTASYYAQGWHTIGTTTNGMVNVEMLPGSYSFAMTYNGTREQLNAVNISQTPTVTFQTVAVTLELRDHNGALIADRNGTGSYYAQGWHSVGDTTQGTISVELLPGSYSFAMEYLGTRAQLNARAVSVGDSTVTFQTGEVDSSTATGYYAQGWRSFTTGMELLPGTYTFSFSGAPNQKYIVVGGTINTIP